MDGDARPRRSIVVLIFAIVNALAGVPAAYLMPVVIGDFAKMFKRFDIDTPAPTRRTRRRGSAK